MSTIENESPKDRMIAILRDQPDDSTFDELLRELACRRAIARGLKDVDESNTVTNEEALRRIKSWQR
jgi:predicted transcriptional regulator